MVCTWPLLVSHQRFVLFCSVFFFFLFFVIYVNKISNLKDR